MEETETLGFRKESTLEIGPRTTIERGEIISIAGRASGHRWKFLWRVNPNDGRRAPWVDVVEVSGAKNRTIGGVRSFPAADVRGRLR